MLGCTRAPKGIWLLAYKEGNYQLKSPDFVDNWPLFTIEISNPITFSSENHYTDCIVIAKTLIDSAESTMFFYFYGRM